MNNSFAKRIVLGLSVGILAGSVAYIYKQQHVEVLVQKAAEQGPIYDYDEAKDKQSIIDFYNTEWYEGSDRYWLLHSDESNFDPEFMLRYKAPNENPLYLGHLVIKVLRINDKFVGFTAYYKETPTLGWLLFLAVKKEYRGKGYAKMLAQYAINDLESMGSDAVKLITRSNNLGAQSIYRKLGFEEVGREGDEFIYFEKQLK